MATTLQAQTQTGTVEGTKGDPRRSPFADLLAYLFLGLLAVFFLFPLAWMMLSSLKTGQDIATTPLVFDPRAMSFDSYGAMLANVPLLDGFKNTLIVVVFKGGLELFFCPLAGYTFAKLRFRGREALFNIVLATLMLPVIVMLIPLLLEMGALGWVDSYQALILPGAVSAFAIFFMRQQMADIPDELIESGRLDGAGPFRIYWSIALPIMRPALAALAILTFLAIYNDFVWPVIVISSVDKQTLQIMLSYLATQINNASVGTAGSNAWGQILAASTLATLPLLILFIALQRHFVAGLMAGALKG
jgi:ABC-type glycerol-3-phosphate transport system permease component